MRYQTALRPVGLRIALAGGCRVREAAAFGYAQTGPDRASGAVGRKTGGGAVADETIAPGGEEQLREQAIKSVKKKRDFRTHLFTYVWVNALLVVIWAVTGADFFWPVFPIAGWAVGLAFNAWDVYGRKPISEADIHQEMERLRR
jgi:hypothetical protein